ncbi:MAG TPA: preprotein translocase subunit SecE [Gemmataceae bacterium]|jgi:preprotein translocase SecE subunit|nr:preprotein translocase subunit SecE [Gemmataceae bacterium]
MAVAVKNNPESQTRTAQASLMVSSLAGAAYILACIGVIFWAVPYLWEVGIASHLPENLSFVSYAGLIVVEVVAIGILSFLGMALVGPTPPRGLRAGVFLVLAWLFATGCVTVVVGRILEGFLSGTPAIGIALTVLVALGLLYWGWSLMSRPKAPETLRGIEDQGWFSSERLKPAQGQRVRRATMLGIILLVAAGIYSLYSHGTLNTVGKDWVVRLPFTADRFLFLLPDVRFTVPLIFAAVGLWLAFRVVHLPVFADFLIATEAELNKVSWPTRRSVVQDTIVVLATVFLLTVFLFLVDIGWGALLGSPYVGIIRQPDTQKSVNQPVNVDKIPY